MVPLVAAAGSAAIDLAGNWIGQEASLKKNKELMDYQYDKDVEMWEKANAYNDPSQQMARLKNAGLNPNLVYGNGSVVGNTSTATPSYKAPTADYTIPKVGMMEKYNQIRQNEEFQQTQDALQQQYQASTDKTYADMLLTLDSLGEHRPAQRSLWESQKGVNTSNVRKNDTISDLNEFQLGRNQKFLPYQEEALRLQNRNLSMEIQNKASDLLTKMATRSNMRQDYYLKALTGKEKERNIINQRSGTNPWSTLMRVIGAGGNKIDLDKEQIIDGVHWNPNK